MNNLKNVESIPGDLGLPILGEVLEQFSCHQKFFLDRFYRYGPIFRTKVLYMKAVCLAEEKANQLVLRDKVEHFSNEQGWVFLKPFFGGGLFTQDGLAHARAKRLMMPAFHARAVENYFDLIERLAIEHFEKQKNCSPSSVLNFFRKITLNTMIYLVFGGSVKNDLETIRRWFIDLNDGIQTVIRIDIPVTKYGRSLSARRNLERYILDRISERRLCGLKESTDILSLLMESVDENGSFLKEDEIVSQVLQILFGGFETTAEFLSWSLYCLEKHSNWRCRLEDEQEQILGKGNLQVFSLRSFSYLSYFLKEVERLYPPVYAYPRKVTKDFEYGGYLIPKGWFIFLSPLITHRLPDLFENPDIFDPMRFAPPREEHKRSPFALIGFGAGAHKCLGYELATLEIKIVLSTLLKYNWKIVTDLSKFPSVPDNRNLKELEFIIGDRDERCPSFGVRA